MNVTVAMTLVLNWLRSATRIAQTRRRAAAWVALLAFTGAQLAVSVHACAPAKSGTAVGLHAASQTAHADCHDAGQDTEPSESRSALCKKHCENNGQQLLKAWPADLPAAMAVQVQPSVQFADHHGQAGYTLSPERAGSPDPPFLRSRVLLI